MRRRCTLSLLGLCFQAVVYCPVHSQESDAPAGGVQLSEQLVHDRWSVHDGLPVNHANALYQTPDGYIWLATFDGLVRFDGVRFVVFTAGNTEGLPSSRLTKIEGGHGDSFWLGSEQGHLVQVRDSRFESFGPFPEAVSAIYSDGDSLTWIGTNQGLYKYRASHLDPFAESVLRDLWIWDVLRTRDDALWVAASDGGLWRFNGGSVQHFDDDALGLHEPRVLFEDEHETLWVGGDGVARYLRGAFEKFDPPGAPWSSPQRSLIRVLRFYAVGDGPLWFDTSVGHYRYDGHRVTPLHVRERTSAVDPSGTFSAFATCPDGSLWAVLGTDLYNQGQRAASVESPIRGLLCDREGSVWVTTQGDGLHRFRRPLIRTYSEAEGLGFRNVYHIYEGISSDVWFSGYGGTISRLRGETFRHFRHGEHFSAVDDSLAASDQAMHEDRSGNLWLGFQICDVARRTRDGACTRFSWAAGAPRHEGVFAIRETRDGALWFGVVSGSGAGLYRHHAGQWMHFTTDDGLPDAHVRYLLETRDGSLWIATLRGGVARFRDGRFTIVSTREGLSSPNVRALYEDEDGLLWIGTEDRGLNRLDTESGSITVIRQADGLYYDGIHQILEDDHERIWMSTNRGLFWVRRDELNAFARKDTDHVRSVFYTEHDGMRNREANGGRQASALRAADGRLWFATQDGAVVVNPAEVDQNPLPPPVVIEHVSAGSSAVAIEALASTLAAAQRSFTIAYTAPSFTAPERIRFRYQLAGFDEGWVEAGYRREAVYTNVPAGHYVFRVIASNGDGVWNDQGAALALTVAPFYYETRWFYAISALIAVLLLFAGQRHYTRHHRRRERELEVLVEHRTEALRREKQKTEEQAQNLRDNDQRRSRFFANISHEFRTPLTLTFGPIDDLLGGRFTSISSARPHFEQARRNSSRLLRLINQLLDLSRLDAGALLLHPRQHDLGRHLNQVSAMFRSMAEAQGIHYISRLPVRPLVHVYDDDKIEKVVVNLLSNAFKFTRAGGKVSLSLDRDAIGGACITIADTGHGIAPEHLDRLFDRFYQVESSSTRKQEGSGIGLALVKELVELHDGTVKVDSTVGFGTRFVVSLPMVQSTLVLAEHEDGLVAGDADMHLAGPEWDELGHVVPSSRASQAEATDRKALIDETIVLVIEDNADMRSYIRYHLEDQFTVVEAENGQLGLARARDLVPDLVVSDVMMPEMDGLETCAAIKADELTSHIPVVLLTAQADVQHRIDAFELGADAYLAKPFSAEELRVRVRTLVEERRRLRARYSRTSGAEGPLPTTPDLNLLPRETAFLEKVSGIIEAHLADTLFGVDALADALAMSRRQLFRKLGALVDETPATMIRRMRLEHAAALLLEQEMSVKEVCAEVGFSSNSSFARAFRERHGVPPSEYASERTAS